MTSQRGRAPRRAILHSAAAAAALAQTHTPCPTITNALAAKPNLTAQTIAHGTCCDPPELAQRIALDAIKTGYTHIDTAAHYDSETTLADAIQEAQKLGYIREKDDISLTSKVWFDSMGYDATLASATKSLQRLRVERLDLLLVHFPGAPDAVQDPKKNAKLRASTWRAFETLLADGLVTQIGVSNYQVRHLRELLSYCTIPPAVLQTEIHPRFQQERLVEECERFSVRVQAFCPLAHGSRDLLEHPSLVQIADQVGKTPAQVALRWSIQKGFTPIVHSRTAARLRENLEALQFDLSPASMSLIDTMDAGNRASFDPSLIA